MTQNTDLVYRQIVSSWLRGHAHEFARRGQRYRVGWRVELDEPAIPAKWFVQRRDGNAWTIIHIQSNGSLNTAAQCGAEYIESVLT